MQNTCSTSASIKCCWKTLQGFFNSSSVQHTERSATTVIKASLVSHSSMHCKNKLTDSQAVMHSCTQQASSIKHNISQCPGSRCSEELLLSPSYWPPYCYYLLSMINTIVYRIWHKVALFSQLIEKNKQEPLHKFWLTLN